MGKQVDSKPFPGDNYGERVVSVRANGGTATLEHLLGDDPYSATAIWQPVTDGQWIADTTFCLKHPRNVWYMFKITGAARVWVD